MIISINININEPAKSMDNTVLDIEENIPEFVVELDPEPGVGGAGVGGVGVGGAGAGGVGVGVEDGPDKYTDAISPIPAIPTTPAAIAALSSLWSPAPPLVPIENNPGKESPKASNDISNKLKTTNCDHQPL